MRYHFVFTEWFDLNLKLLRKHNPGLRADLDLKVAKENLSPAEQERISSLIQAIKRQEGNG